MKKILFLLLFTVSIYGQTLQNPTFGTVTEKNNATDSTPSYFVTQEVDGVHKKTPAALIALKSDLPTSYAVIVYVNAANPNSATIFDDVNPPTTNDNAFKTDADNLYIGADASTWVYNGSAYITKSVPASSNFFIRGTTVDAGNSKTENIERIGSIKTSQTLDAGNVNTGGVLANSIVSNGEIVSKKAGSDTVNSGSAFRLSNNSETENNQFQLNASNGVDLWNYASGVWNKHFTFSSNGDFTSKKLISKVEGLARIEIGGVGNGRTITAYDESGNVSNLDVTQGFASPNAYINALTGYSFSNAIIMATNTIKFQVNYVDKFKVTDTGADVIGNISATNYTGGATLTGTPTAPTAPVGTNTTQIATTAFVQGVDANVVHKTGEETIGLGEKYFTDNVNFADIAVSGQATGMAAVFPNEFVIKSQLDLKAPLSSPTFTGTPTAPTATAGTNTTQIATTAFVQAAIGNYKKYVALLSQSGTNAPTATVLENTLGGTVVWTRNSTGLYTGTLAGVFTANKTWTSITSTATGTVTGAVSTSVDTVTVATSSLDSALTNSAIEIRVYN